MVARYVSGRPLDGMPRTDARFFHRGTRALTRTGHASRWAMLPGWQRAAWRLGTPVVAASSAVGALTAPLATQLTWEAIGAATGVWAGDRAVLRVQRRTLNRRLVRPLYSALRVPLALPDESPDRWLTVPVSYRTNPEAIIGVRLPDEFLATDEQKRLIANTIRHRLGGEWDAHWHLDGYPLSLEMRQPPEPPRVVTFADAVPILARTARGKLFLGNGTRGEEVWLDLDAETPHVAMSMGTGGGKSSTLRVLISQLARGGAERVMILDPKRVSQQWADGVPGVTIYRTPEEWVSAISEFRTEMENRYDEIQEDTSRTFPRWVLVVEEMNSMTALLRQWWNSVREKEDPKNPPALDDLGFILFMGRQACMNVIAVLQQANARAMGGSDFRDQFGCKILARFSPQVWNMLVGTYPRPKSSRHPGRALVLIGDEEMRVQLAFFSEDEARAYALADRQPVIVTPRRAPADHGDGAVTVTEPPSLTVIDGGEPERVTLAEAARLHIVPMSYDALRQAKARRAKNGFPVGRTRDGKTTYTPHELRAWRSIQDGTGPALVVVSRIGESS